MIPNFTSIIELIKAFPDEQSCIDHLERLRWNGNVISPFDANSKVYKCKNNRYKCTGTNKYFNVRTETIFGDTKLPLQKWFMALYIFGGHKKGISSHQLARDLDITQKSAWFVLHRLRYAFNHPEFRKVVGHIGIIEIDETNTKGEGKNRHANKKKLNAKGNMLREKTCVLGILERGGNVLATVVPNRHTETIIPLIIDSIVPTAVIVTDELSSYKNLYPNYFHETVRHGAKEYVRGMVHTNGIENFWSHLKRGIDGIYHWVSMEHLQAYVDEFALRYNSRKFETQERFDMILANVAGKRLTYETLISHE